MATQMPKIIGIITSKLPYDLANQLYHEFESRNKEAVFLIENARYYKRLKKDIKTVEILLALSIFHKRVITNLDAAVKFHKTVTTRSSASVVSIGSYDLDENEKNKLLGMLINYKKLKDRFGIYDYIFEYHETREFLKELIKFKQHFGKRSKPNNTTDEEEEKDLPF